VAVIPSYIASCQINVVKPLQALHNAGRIKFRHVLESKANLASIRWADVIVFCRNTEPGYGHFLSEAIGRKKPIIYDIDDSFWDISERTDPELARYHLQPLRLRQFEQYISHASLVRVYSPLLKGKIDHINQNVRIYHSGFDFKLVPNSGGPDQQQHNRNQSSAQCDDDTNRAISIVYATSRIVDDQYKIFLPALSDFLKANQGRVKFTVWGCSPGELLNLPGVSARKLTTRYDDFLRAFSRAGFHIGLAPLQDTEFNRSKNNTKFRDYGACRIAGIYSNLDVYGSSVVHEQNGLLVSNKYEDWLEALNRLTFEPELRRRIIARAYDDVFNGYRQELIERQWLDDIDRLLEDAQSFWLSRLGQGSFAEFNIFASQDNLCGVKLTAEALQFDLTRSSDEKEKVCLEVRAQNGCTLRGIAASVRDRNPIDGSVTFSFQPLKNSRSREFLLRIGGIRNSKLNAGSHITLLYKEPVSVEHNW